jgi:hypothetical protein
VRTDATGRASCADWTLGASSGLNVMSASVSGLSPVNFVAKAARASADVSVTLTGTSDGEIVGDVLTFAATVASTYPIASVTAFLGGEAIDVEQGAGWRRTISLTDLPWINLPRGPIGLVVVATDVRGNTTEAVVVPTLDRKPRINIASPLDLTVARPSLSLSATCADDDPAGCASLNVKINQGPPITQGKSVLSSTIDLSAHEGQSIPIEFTVADSAGQETVVVRTVFVESSARLTIRAEVTGPILDARGSRVLFIDTSKPGNPSLAEVDGAAQPALQYSVEWPRNTVEPQNVNTADAIGHLTEVGAVFSLPLPRLPVEGQIPSYLYQSRPGLGAVNIAVNGARQHLSVAGDWVIYGATPSIAHTYPTTWWLRNLRTDFTSALTVDGGGFQVAANADIVYLGDADFSSPSVTNKVFRLRAGQTQELSSNAYFHRDPVTDGVNVAYSRVSLRSSEWAIAVHDGSSETFLTPVMRFSRFTPGPPSLARTGYAVAGGFVAYSNQDLASVYQVWRRRPDGALEQLSQFGTDSIIDAISPDGTVIFSHGLVRYRAAPGAALVQIGSSLGRVVYRDGKFLVLLGRTVLEVGP